MSGSATRSWPRRTATPLALLELPRRLTAEDLAGGFGLPGALPLSGSMEENFRRQIEELPAGTRRLLQLAAAEPAGDPALVWRAAGRLGIDTAAAEPAEGIFIEGGDEPSPAQPAPLWGPKRLPALADLMIKYGIEAFPEN